MMRSAAKTILRGIFGLAAAFAIFGVNTAHADDCPGNPDALGTSRTLVVDPTEHPRVGTMQYHETLPLHDHEVVLTFDDGPLPAHSNKVLATLAAECVKATFFTIGHMAQQYPDGVRRLRAAGHTIGTHSENHPLSFNRMPIERAMQEINDGIDHTAAALGDPSDVAPFFRIPGLLRADGVESYLVSRGIMVWSADFPADDWRHISSARVLQLALTRLEAHRKGILLLHDIQARTAAMLPTLLRQLKARGYHIVHVVVATPDLPKTPTEPQDWLMHPDAEIVAGWPAVPRFVYTETAAMAAPGIIGTDYAGVSLRPIARPLTAQRDHFAVYTVPLPPEPFWPEPTPISTISISALPVPDRSIFDMPNLPGADFWIGASRSQHAGATSTAGLASRKATRAVVVRRPHRRTPVTRTLASGAARRSTRTAQAAIATPSGRVQR
jgi:peptidoglycan-N-acetylglucosamine deacetylase